MKILFAIKNMNNAKGGAERVISIVVNGLAAKGYEITLLTFDERGLDTFYYIDKKIKRISLGIGDSVKKAGIRETFARMRAMRCVVQVRKPDVVIPFMHSMYIPMSFALLGMKLPIIASEHIVPLYYRNKRSEFILLMLSSLLVRKITVLSDSVKTLYPYFIRKKMIVMPNPVYLPPEEETLQNTDLARKVILNVGRLSDQKDQKTLIRSFALIAEKYPEWDVRIAGEGDNLDFLKKLIEKLNLETRVHLIGTTHHIAKEYEMAQIFAMPSKYESFGLATAEAMSFGVPAIGFRECAGTNEIIIHNKNGLLVDRKGQHIQNFADGLEQLIKNKSLRTRLGKNARRDIAKYQPSMVVDLWEKMILEEMDFSNKH